MKNKYKDMAEIVARVKKKDDDAFVELYNNMYQQVYFLALSIVKNQYLAQDVVQETFINVYNSIHTLNNDMTFIAWVDRITYNCSLKIIAKNGEVPLENAVVEKTFSGADREDPLELVLSKEKSRTMMNLILELSPEYRTTLILKYYEGMKLEEIASCMECSVGTVKSRLNRGKNALRKSILSGGSISRLFMLLAVGGFTMAFSIRSYAQEQLMDAPMAKVALDTINQKLLIIPSAGFQAALRKAKYTTPMGILAGTAGLMLLVVGAFWESDIPSIMVHSLNDTYTNTQVEVQLEVKSYIPVKKVRIVFEEKEVPVMPTDSKGVYKAEIKHNGVYQAQVVSWNGKRTDQNFEITSIDQVIPQMYWYNWNTEQNTFYCLVSDDLSGVNYEKIYQEDSNGKKYDPIRYNEAAGEIVFSLLEVPFNIILYDNVNNIATYKIESYIY